MDMLFAAVVGAFGVACTGYGIWLAITENANPPVPDYRKKLEDRYVQWQVFLLNVRIAAYQGKETKKDEAPKHPAPFLRLVRSN